MLAQMMDLQSGSASLCAPKGSPISCLPSEVLEHVTLRVRKPLPQEEDTSEGMQLSLAQRFALRVQQRDHMRRARLVSRVFSKAATDSIRELEAPGCNLPAAMWDKYRNAKDCSVTSSTPGSITMDNLAALIPTLPERLELLGLRGLPRKRGNLFDPVLTLPRSSASAQQAQLVNALSAAQFAPTLLGLAIAGIDGMEPGAVDSIAAALPKLEILEACLSISKPSTWRPAQMPANLHWLALEYGRGFYATSLDLAGLAGLEHLETLEITGGSSSHVNLLNIRDLSGLTALTYLSWSATTHVGTEPQDIWALLAALPNLGAALLRSTSAAFQASSKPLGSELFALILGDLTVDVPDQQLPGSLASATPGLCSLDVDSTSCLARLFSACKGHQQLTHLRALSSQVPEQWQPGLLSSLPALKEVMLYAGRPTEFGAAPAAVVPGGAHESCGTLDSMLADMAACQELECIRLLGRKPPSREALLELAEGPLFASRWRLSLMADHAGCSLSVAAQLLAAASAVAAGSHGAGPGYLVLRYRASCAGLVGDVDELRRAVEAAAGDGDGDGDGEVGEQGHRVVLLAEAFAGSLGLVKAVVAELAALEPPKPAAVPEMGEGGEGGLFGGGGGGVSKDVAATADTAADREARACLTYPWLYQLRELLEVGEPERAAGEAEEAGCSWRQGGRVVTGTLAQHERAAAQAGQLVGDVAEGLLLRRELEVGPVRCAQCRCGLGVTV